MTSLAGAGSRPRRADDAAVPTRRRVFGPVLVALSAIAWLALAAWELSPYAHFMHAEALDIPAVACAPPPPAWAAGLYLAGWLLMTLAMMLPTIAPLVAVFAKLTERRANRGALVAWLGAGYLVAWGAFGTLALGLHSLLHAWTADSGWLWAHAWTVGAGALALAGAFQFSRLKYRCLDECRSPLAFVVARWRGVAPRREALRLGVDHGLYCIGCCWALMLLMFTVGLGSLGWMLVLAAIMAIEKNLPWGRQLARPVGIGLLAAGGAIAFVHVAPLAG